MEGLEKTVRYLGWTCVTLNSAASVIAVLREAYPQAAMHGVALAAVAWCLWYMRRGR